MKISLVMITKNEEKNIAKSLESVKGLVNEIIIVDSGSTDNTNKIAQSYGAKIFKRQFDSFLNQKNYALSLAMNEWVLHLDADEVLSNELREEIRNIMENNTEYDGFILVRTNFFLGRQMKYSGLNKEERLRFAKKSLSKYVGGCVHERLEVNGNIGKLKNVFYHNSYPDLDNCLKKIDTYTSLAAIEKYQSKKNFYITDILLRPIIVFIKIYFFKLGFLDKMEGFIWAAISSYTTFIKYLKFYLLKKQLKTFSINQYSK